MVVSECLFVAMEGSLEPFEFLAILPLEAENQAHIVGSAESGRVVFSKCLLPVTEGSVVPFKSLAILPWFLKTEPMLLTVSRAEGWWSIPSVFSLPSRARWYHSSALLYSFWLSKTMPMLWTAVRVEGWSFPSVSRSYRGLAGTTQVPCHTPICRRKPGPCR
jgi:hypothetical protein